MKNALEKLRPPVRHNVELPIGVIPKKKVTVMKDISEFSEEEFKEWLYKEYEKNQGEVLRAKRSDFLKAVASAYKVGKRSKKK